jgi:hypothetical protein
MIKQFLYIFLLCSLIAFNAKGQLNGNYTVGGTSPNFNTVKEALDTLAAQGASGPCTFLVRPGIYLGPFGFLNMSYGYHIQFRGESGDPKDVQMEVDRLQDVFDLSIKHVTILPRLNNWTLYPLKGMEIYGANILIDSCVFLGPTTSPTFNNAISIVASLGSPISPTQRNGITLSNLAFKNFDLAVSLSVNKRWGSSSSFKIPISILQCTFDSTDMGIHIHSQNRDSIFITDNTFLRPETAIEIDGDNNISGVRNLYINRNNIINAKHYGIYAYDVVEYPGWNQFTVRVQNNMIGIDTASTYGAAIFFKNSGDIVFENNSLSGTFYLEDMTDSPAHNNSFFSSKGSAVIVDNTALPIGDFNNYFAPNGKLLADRGNSTEYNTLSEIQALESNSISNDPFYFNDSNLHSYSPFLQNAGTSLHAPQTDIDHETRVNAPDIGADEYKNAFLFPFAWYHSMCLGNPLERQFQSLSVRPDSLLWEFGDGDTSTQSSPVHQFMPGTYLCSLTVTNPYGSSSTFVDSLVITPNPLAVIELAGDSLTVSGNYNNYVWLYNNGDFPPGLGKKTIKPLLDGNYTLLYMDSSGCERITLAYNYITPPSPTGLAQLNEQGFKLFPNPSKGHLSLLFQEKRERELRITQVNGKIVYYLKLDNSLQQEIDLPHSLGEGLYFVSVINDNSVYHKKFILKR